MRELSLYSKIHLLLHGVVIRLLVAVLPIDRLASGLRIASMRKSISIDPARVHDVCEWIFRIRVFGCRLFAGNCRFRAALVYSLYRRIGVYHDLVLGIAHGQGKIQLHCWVDVQGPGRSAALLHGYHPVARWS